MKFKLKYPRSQKSRKTVVETNIRNMKKEIKSLMGAQEGDRFDIGTNNAIPTGYNLPDTTFMPIQHNFTLTSEGDDNNNRQGDVITVKTIRVKYQIEASPKQSEVVTFVGGVTANGNINVRVIIGRVKAMNNYNSPTTAQTQPSYGQFLALKGISVANMTTGNLMGHVNPLNNNIVVMYDKIHVIHPLNYTLEAATPLRWNDAPWHSLSFKCPAVQTTYTGTTATLANQSTNHYFMWAYTDNSLAADANPPLISFHAETEFGQ